VYKLATGLSTDGAFACATGIAAASANPIPTAIVAPRFLLRIVTPWSSVLVVRP
jgi:hypothetical protein